MTAAHAFNPIRSVESAWKLLLKAPLPLAVGGLILVIVQGVMGAGYQFTFSPGSSWHPGFSVAVLAPLLFLSAGISIAVMAVVSWLSVGYYNGVQEVMYRGDTEFEKLFDPRGRWLSMFLTRLLQGFLGFLAAMLLGIGPLAAVIMHEAGGLDEDVAVAAGFISGLLLAPIWAYLTLGLMFAPYAAAFEEIGPFDAIARSWELARGNRWMLVVFALGSAAVALVGLAMCCVGVLPASILIEVMWVEAYVRAVRGDEVDGWWVVTRGRGADPAPSVENSPPREVPVEPTPEPPAPEEVAGEEEGEDDGPFDPGAWRKQAGLPPFDG
jgi:hypothetical protein